MRIIAGKYRRRILKSNPGMTTRPITDRAKEQLFANLKDLVVDASIADIFCGTGSMGLEAISRGARASTFIDFDRTAIQLVRENIDTLGVKDITCVWPNDLMRCSFKPKNVDHLLPWTLLFFDPPYKMVKDCQPGERIYKSLERLAHSPATAKNALLIFRTPIRSDFEMPPEWVSERLLKVTSMDMHFFRLQKEATDAVPEEQKETSPREPGEAETQNKKRTSEDDYSSSDSEA